jgi:hypothetical protein
MRGARLASSVRTEGVVPERAGLPCRAPRFRLGNPARRFAVGEVRDGHAVVAASARDRTSDIDVLVLASRTARVP